MSVISNGTSFGSPLSFEELEKVKDRGIRVVDSLESLSLWDRPKSWLPVSTSVGEKYFEVRKIDQQYQYLFEDQPQDPKSNAASIRTWENMARINEMRNGETHEDDQSFRKEFEEALQKIGRSISEFPHSFREPLLGEDALAKIRG